MSQQSRMDIDDPTLFEIIDFAPEDNQAYQDQQRIEEKHNCVSRMLGGALYHTVDFLRIGLVTQSLTARWAYQLFLELKEFDSAPSIGDQQKYLGFPIIGASLLAALVVKIINCCKQGRYPASQDYLFATFSSASIYILMDSIMSQHDVDALPWWTFVLTSVLVPASATLLVKLTVTDSADRFIVCPRQFNQENFPAYPTASRAEKWLNTLLSASLIVGLTSSFWVIKREINHVTVPLAPQELMIIGGYGLLMTGVSYALTSMPKLFHGALALSKALRDGALSYAALSGIGFHVLNLINDCEEAPCWDQSDSDMLTKLFVPVAVVIGAFSAATTLFRYAANHVANRNLIRCFSRCFRRNEETRGLVDRNNIGAQYASLGSLEAGIEQPTGIRAESKEQPEVRDTDAKDHSATMRGAARLSDNSLLVGRKGDSAGEAAAPRRSRFDCRSCCIM